MLKLPVSVYRRSKSKPAFPAVTFPPECMMAAGLESGQLGYAVAASGIVVVCTPDWERAVSEFLAGQRGDQNVSAAEADNGAQIRESQRHGAGTRSASAQTQR